MLFDSVEWAVHRVDFDKPDTIVDAIAHCENFLESHVMETTLRQRHFIDAFYHSVIISILREEGYSLQYDEYCHDFWWSKDQEVLNDQKN